MTPRRLTTILLAPIAGIVLALLVATPAAAVTPSRSSAVLSSFTQTNATSYNGWNAARQNQGAWAEYAFDWSTDYCSASPDQPLGLRLPALVLPARLRVPQLQGAWASSDANKPRIDDAFYFDLRAKCATYNVFVRPGVLQPGLDATTRRSRTSAAWPCPGRARPGRDAEARRACAQQALAARRRADRRSPRSWI